ncbi:GRIK3 [Mytilus coruscus]|uniref:GRIK3 n=1 Tax=Mytilus coruscus TaxID=42192 RepID=A0A6J8ANL6_MYTCO|nr:GRIK3 [Mytilus coruscus]
MLSPSTSVENSSYHCPEMLSQQSLHSSVGGVSHSNIYDHNYTGILMLILQKLKWSNAILIYDDNTEFIVSGKDRHQMDGIFLSTYKISNENRSEDIYKFLKDVYNTMVSQLSVVVVGDTKMMKRLMTEVNTFDDKRIRETAMSYHSRWFLFHVDNTPLTDVNYLSNLNNVAVINLPLNRMTLDMPTYLTLQFILENLSTNNEVIEALEHSDELSPGCFNGTLITKVQDEIRNISHQFSPFEYVENGIWKGLCIDLLKELSRDLNFTYQIVTSPDGEWGRFVNMSWTGMIGQLERREVDLTVTPLSIQEERERVMDFTLGFFVDALLIIMKKPDPNKTKWLRLIKPLRWEVMVLTGFLIPIISAMLFLTEKFNPYYKYDLKIGALPDYFWYCFGCVFMQATYSGNLIAYLTVPIEKLPFDSPATMIEQTEYEWGTTGGTYWQMFFEHSTNPTNQAVWKGIVASNKTDKRVLSYSENDHMQKVKEDHYAYIAEKSYLEVVVSEDCELAMTTEEILTVQYGVGLSNNSPYTKIFSDSILHILESGLIQIWKQKHWPKRNFCAGSLLTEAKPIMWIDIQIAFYFLGGGTLLGFLVLFVEYIIRKCKELKTRFNDITISKSHYQEANGLTTNP